MAPAFVAAGSSEVALALTVESRAAADVYLGCQVDWGLAFGSIASRPAFVACAERYMPAKAIDNALIEAAYKQG